MNKVKLVSFLHLTDVHLGKVNSILNKDLRYEDFFIAFEKGIQAALEKKVNFVLISGDLFDSSQPTPQTLIKCENILNKLKNENIPIFSIEGNHDIRKSENMSWIDYLQEKNLLIHLSVKYDENNNPIILEYDKNKKYGTLYKYNSKLNIIGLGWLGSKVNEKLELLFNQISGNNNIILLHALLESWTLIGIGIIDKNILKNNLDKFIYMALGHGHTKKSYYNKIFNPGSSEYVRVNDFNNPERGYYFVEIYENKENNFDIKTVHINSKKRDYLKLQFDMTNLKKENIVDKIVEEIMSNWSDDFIKPFIHIELQGSSSNFSRHTLPYNKIRNLLAKKIDFLSIQFIDNMDYNLNYPILRGGKDTLFSLEKMGKEKILQIIIEEFENDDLIDIRSAEKLTNLIWDSHDEIIKGLEQEEKESFIKNIYKSLWDKE